MGTSSTKSSAIIPHQIPFGLYHDGVPPQIPGFNPFLPPPTHSHSGYPALGAEGAPNGGNVQFALLPPQQMPGMNPVFGPGSYLPPYDIMQRPNYGEQGMV